MEISGIEPLTFPAVNAGKPPKADLIEMQEVSGVRTCSQQRKKTGTKPVFFVGGDKRDRTADLSGGKRRKARRRRVLIEMQEVSGVQTCRFHQMKKAAFRLPRSFGGDKRDRTADLLNAIERLATFDGEKVREIANIKSF